MPLVYKCDKCREYTGEQIIVCPRCASKINEVQPASAQQLKPEMPLLEEVYRSVQCGPYNDLSYRERHVLEASYEFISRHFGR